MVTKHDCMTQRYFRYLSGTYSRSKELKQVRASGQCKTWKTRPDDFKLPVKYGMYESFYITPENAAMFITEDEYQQRKEQAQAVGQVLKNPSRKSLRSLKRAEHEHYSRPGVSIDIDVESHNAKRGSRTRVNPRRRRKGFSPQMPRYIVTYLSDWGNRVRHEFNFRSMKAARSTAKRMNVDDSMLEARAEKLDAGSPTSYRPIKNPMKGEKHIALQEKRGESWFTIAWFPHNQKATAIKIGKQLHRRYPSKTLRLFA